MLDIGVTSPSLSCSIPNVLRLEYIGHWARCHVIVNGKEIYAAILQAYNDIIYFYGLKDLVEEYMRNNNISKADFIFEMEDDYGGDMTDNITLFYSAYRHFVNNESDFLESNFLSSRKSYVVPRTGDCYIPFAFLSTDEILVQVEFKIRTTSNEIRINTFSEPIQQRHEINTYTAFAGYDYVLSKCHYAGELLSAEVRCGNRRKTVYYTDEIPVVSFFFLNAYNCLEVVNVIGKETVKTEFSNKEAVCNGEISYFDEKMVKKHYIETAAMSIDEANWFNEFLYSKLIEKEVNANPRQTAKVIISDISSEIIKAPNEPTRFKFAWRFADNNDYPNN